MSRVAKKIINIPDDVNVSVTGNEVCIDSSKGTLNFILTKEVSLKVDTNEISVISSDNQESIAMAGTTRSIIHNMIVGLSVGFEKKLELVGVGYRAKASGKTLDLTLGFSHPIKYELPESVTVETPSQTEIVLKSFDKQAHGQTAAEIRAIRPPEPYKGKGVRYSDERIRRKEAKKAAGGA